MSVTGVLSEGDPGQAHGGVRLSAFGLRARVSEAIWSAGTLRRSGTKNRLDKCHHVMLRSVEFRFNV